jgi:hypothetical protein
MKRPTPKLVDVGKSKSRKSKKQRASEAHRRLFVHKDPAGDLIRYFKDKESR